MREKLYRKIPKSIGDAISGCAESDYTMAAFHILGRLASSYAEEREGASDKLEQLLMQGRSGQ